MEQGCYWKMDNSDKVKEVLLFQVNRSIVNFYKNHLTMIEDLKREHQTMLKKVEKKTSKEFSESIDTFDNDKYNYIRKKRKHIKLAKWVSHSYSTTFTLKFTNHQNHPLNTQMSDKKAGLSAFLAK